MSSGFVTTQWNVVREAGDGRDLVARQALETLCRAYWYPLYVYARRSGYDPEQASDVTQAFFADLLERRALRGLDPEKGRFRTFLLASIRNFFSHQRAREQAAKRGGTRSRPGAFDGPRNGPRTVSLDVGEGERRWHFEPVTELTPERLFERRWGLTVMERAMVRLEAQCESGGRPQLFAALRPYLTGGEHASYRDVAAQLAMSVGAIKVAVHRLRQSYGRLLRQEIAATVLDPSQVDDELRYLLNRIRPWRA